MPLMGGGRDLPLRVAWWKLVLLVTGLVALGLAVRPAVAADAAGSTFKVTYDPPLDKVVAHGNPDSPKTLTHVSIQAIGPDGRPLRDAVIEASLTAPDPSSLAGSDVPRVEGRRLLHTRFAAPEGRYDFSYVLPIRGDYRLDLEAAPGPGARAGFAPFSRTQTFNVGERSGELRAFVLLLIGLFAFGVVSAVLLARPHLRAARARTSGARTAGWTGVPGLTGATVALGLLLAAFVAFLAIDNIRESRSDSRVAGYQGAGAGIDRTARNEQAALRYHVSRSAEDGVGTQTLVQTRGSLGDPSTGAPIAGAAVRIDALDLETGKPAFRTEAPPVAGRFAWDVLYWDGVDYDVRIGAVPGTGGPRFAPLTTGTELAVQPLAPPISIKLVSLVWLLAPLVAGMVAGLLLARRRVGRRPERGDRRVGMPAPGGAA